MMIADGGTVTWKKDHFKGHSRVLPVRLLHPKHCDTT